VIDCAIHGGPRVGVPRARSTKAVKVTFPGVLFVPEEEHVLEKVSQACMCTKSHRANSLGGVRLEIMNLSMDVRGGWKEDR
jgi:hypothetical protein